MLLYDGKGAVYQFMMAKVPYTRLWRKCTILVYDGKSALFQVLTKVHYTSL